MLCQPLTHVSRRLRQEKKAQLFIFTQLASYASYKQSSCCGLPPSWTYVFSMESPPSVAWLRRPPLRRSCEKKVLSCPLRVTSLLVASRRTPQRRPPLLHVLHLHARHRRPGQRPGAAFPPLPQAPPRHGGPGAEEAERERKR